MWLIAVLFLLIDSCNNLLFGEGTFQSSWQKAGLAFKNLSHVTDPLRQRDRDSPGVIAVLHSSEAHPILTHHVDEWHHKPFHEGLDHAEVGPSDAGGSIHQEHNISRVDVGADHCKVTAGMSEEHL